MNILAIETSCDETAVAVLKKTDNNLRVRANIVASQIALHRAWGGVVPNLAGREHAKNIIPVITEAMEKSQCTKNDIDLIAVTAGPGLIPALLIGVSAAKTLAYSWHKPLLGIHHIEGHIYANWIGADKPQFPAIALVVSGGHTQIILMRAHTTYEIIGQTHDDAVGEAFDKVARLLGLPYPGGPEIAKQAQCYDATSNPYDIQLPRPMLHTKDYHFSFSGIKTAVLYIVRKEQNMMLQKTSPLQKTFSKKDYASVTLSDEFIQAVSREFQEAVTEVLINKTIRAAQEYHVHSVILAGGVSANIHLRTELARAIAQTSSAYSFHIPAMDFCLDNATMIAAAAAYRYDHMNTAQKKSLRNGWQTVRANPSLTITTKAS